MLKITDFSSEGSVEVQPGTCDLCMAPGERLERYEITVEDTITKEVRKYESPQYWYDEWDYGTVHFVELGIKNVAQDSKDVFENLRVFPEDVQDFACCLKFIRAHKSGELSRYVESRQEEEKFGFPRVYMKNFPEFYRLVEHIYGLHYKSNGVDRVEFQNMCTSFAGPGTVQETLP